MPVTKIFRDKGCGTDVDRTFRVRVGLTIQEDEELEYGNHGSKVYASYAFPLHMITPLEIIQRSELRSSSTLRLDTIFKSVEPANA